jgi:polyisoprenoid-binding protein YceI
MEIRGMVRFSAVGTLVLALGVVVFLGCANPADDKPVADVSEAAPAPETVAPAAGASAYTIAGGSSLTWVGSKVTGSHEGGFSSFSGSIVAASDNLESAQISIEIDTTSIFSDNERLTGHLKSADFFDVATHATAIFQTTQITKSDVGYDVTGNLSLHGVTKSISFPAQVGVDGDALTATAEFVINRTDFEINYKGKADDLIRDEVVIAFNITAEG